MKLVGFDGLVGRDHDDALGLRRHCRLAHRQRTQDVGGEALVRVGLDERHVLVRCGVEHDGRTLAQEKLAHAARYRRRRRCTCATPATLPSSS